MKEGERIALIIVGLVTLPAGLFLLWSANYSAAYYGVLHSSALWKAFFAGDVFLPAKQAIAYFGDARLKKVIAIATTGSLVEVVILAGVAAALIMKPWAVKPPKDGSRLATLKDLDKAGLLNGKPGFSVLLGTVGKGRQAKEVRYSGDSHFFVNGPSRSGKGRGFVMTNLLEYRGSVLVLDVKLENWEKTGPARLAMGQQCFVFAPGSAMSHRWNPLDFVRGWPERSTDLINLAASLIPLGEKEEPYWKQTARGLFAGVLGYVLESPAMEGRRDLRSALRMFSTGKPFSTVIRKILDEEPDLNQFIIGTFKQHLSRDEEQRPSFEGHITTSLSPFNNLLIAAATSASDFDIRELRRNPFSIFIGSPVSDFGTVEPIIRLLIQQIHDVMLRAMPGKDEPYKILMMLDEFYQFERLPEIIKRAPLVAGYGMTIALIAQNIPQIDERYGVKVRDALLGNMDIQLYIAVGDDTTAKIVSDNLGKYYVEREGWGKGGGFLLGKQASQGRFEPVPLMPPDSVRRLDDANTLLQIRGTYGAVLFKLNFYTDKAFVERRQEASAKASAMPQPLLVEAQEWPLFEDRPAGMAKPPSTTRSGTSVILPNSKVHAIQETLGDDAAYEVEVLARDVFRAPAQFLQIYRQAIAALENAEAAEVLFNLREQPQIYGVLLGADRGLGLKERAARKRASAAIWPLREAIIRQRRQIIEQRARRYAEAEKQIASLKASIPTESSMVPAAAAPAEIVAGSANKNPEPSLVELPSTVRVGRLAALDAVRQAEAANTWEEPDGDDIFGDRPLLEPEAALSEGEAPTLLIEEDDDSDQLNFHEIDEAVGKLAAIADEEMAKGRARDTGALADAVARMQAAVKNAASDDTILLLDGGMAAA